MLLCQQQPDLVEAWFLLGAVHGLLEEFRDAARCFRHVTRQWPESGAAHYNLGLALFRLGDLGGSERSLRQAIQLEPRNAEAHHELANALRMSGRYADAIACYQAAVQLRPDFALAYFNLANIFLKCGEHRSAEQSFRKALAMSPLPSAVHSSLLHVLNYFSSDPQELYLEHRRWQQAHFPTTEPVSHENQPDPARRLRVGYVSADFRKHSVAYFIEPLLKGHDRARFEVYCYSGVSAPDEVTRRLRASADCWRDIHAVSDDEVVQQVSRDRIDILVDLSGHTEGNRLCVFHRKPSPVQITYLGYPNTTGLSTMDYRLTDSLADPEGNADAWYSERLVRLPGGFLCYAPPDSAPPVADSQGSESRRPLTFGSFNHLAKITPQVVATWSAILNNVSGSCLLVKNEALGNSQARDNYYRLFEEHGVPHERVTLRGMTNSLAEHLAMYRQVDVALDTFPYNGATTTCEALWMGVPVVTLSGKTHASRVGASILSQAGLSEFVASDGDEYIRIAVTLARKGKRSADLRQELRSRISRSPLCDRVRFVCAVEDAYCDMWACWCARGGLDSSATDIST